MRKLYLSLLLFISLHSIAQFTPGNIVVSRAGDGATTLSAAATQVQLVEYTTAGVPTGVVVTLPTASGGAGNRACTNSGTATTEGFLSKSQDGRYLIHGGYDAAVGTAGVVASTSDFNRVIARVDAAGTVNTSTSFLATTGNAYFRVNIRAVCSDDGAQFWASGGSAATAGVRYLTLGQDNIAGTQISTTSTNTRGINIFNDQLYITTAAGALRVATVGTGMPTTAGQTITNLPNIPTGTLTPGSFIFFDRDPAIAGVDLLYFTSQTATANEFGLLKYSFDGTNWNAQGKLADATANNSQAIGLTGYLNCSGNVVMYLARSANSTTLGTELRTFTDNAAYNAPITSNGTSITAATTLLVTAAANYGFRGLAMAPAQGYTVTGTQNIAAGSYNVIRVKSGGTATLTGNITVYEKIVIENGGMLDMAGYTISSPTGIGSSFEVQSGGSIKIGSPDGITASAALGNVQTCFRSYNSGANYEYTGTVAQNAGDGLPGTISGSLKINNTSGVATSGVTLAQALTITGAFDMTAGKLTTTNTNLLTLNYSALFVTNASATSFISGPVKKVGSGAFAFPVGKGMIYAPIGLINVSGELATDEFTAEYMRSDPRALHGTAVAGGMDHVSAVEYWSLVQNVGSGTIKKVALAVNYTSFCYDLDNTYVSRWDAGVPEWTNEGSVAVLGPTSSPFESGVITSVSNLTAYGDFTLITDLLPALNPLPVKLISFNATKLSNTHAIINWELAACCSKDARFEVEKSGDGRSFTSIASIAGSETNKSYVSHDTNLEKGITYYRLKAIDVDGKITYSKIVAILNDTKGILITGLSPNPASDQSSLQISAARAGSVNFIVYDIAGRPVKQWKQSISEGSNTIAVDVRSLRNGVYHLAATSEESKTVIRFVKQ